MSRKVRHKPKLYILEVPSLGLKYVTFRVLLNGHTKHFRSGFNKREYTFREEKENHRCFPVPIHLISLAILVEPLRPQLREPRRKYPRNPHVRRVVRVPQPEHRKLHPRQQICRVCPPLEGVVEALAVFRRVAVTSAAHDKDGGLGGAGNLVEGLLVEGQDAARDAMCRRLSGR